MIRATTHVPAVRLTGPVAGTITLNKDQRHRRRIALTTDEGMAFLLDLPRAMQLAHGDGLMLEDGRIIRVAAEPEPMAGPTLGLESERHVSQPIVPVDEPEVVRNLPTTLRHPPIEFSEHLLLVGPPGAG